MIRKYLKPWSYPFTKSVVPEKPSGSNNLFLSVGAMKASTSWMYKVLSLHPDICFCPQKELHYFAHKYGVTSLLAEESRVQTVKRAVKFGGTSDVTLMQERLRWAAEHLADPNSADWFRNQFDLPPQGYMADFSNLTCFIDSAAWRDIFDSYSNVKVIYTMRAPIERLWSHAKFHVAFSTNGQDSISNWEPDQIVSLLRKNFMWKSAEYGRIVERLLLNVPSESLQLSFTDDIFEDELLWLHRLEDFLGISHFDYPKDVVGSKVNVSEKIRMPDWFEDTFQKDAKEIKEQLKDLGQSLPSSW